MENLADLFKLMQITRGQPLYGYNVSEIPSSEVSDLAQHHYLSAFVAWQLAYAVNDAGGSVNVGRILEMALVHDLDELFGGDISFHYARVNPAARKAAKQFQAENHKFLKNFFGRQKNYYAKLVQELKDAKTDESIIAKISDYVEAIHYKIYVKRISRQDLPLTREIIEAHAGKSRNETVRGVLLKFSKTWSKQVVSGSVVDILWGLNK